MTEHISSHDEKHLKSWNASLNPEQVFFYFSNQAQAEIKTYLDRINIVKNITDVKQIETISVDPYALPGIIKDLHTIKKRLKAWHRFVILKPVGGLTFEQHLAVPWIISNLLGTTLAQNREGDRFYIVTDRGGKMEEGARYSQTNQGGSLHTDGVNLKKGYDYFMINCIATALEGGESILISGWTLFHALQSSSPQTLEELSKPFIWEYKGIYHNRFYYEPILKMVDGEPRWRYLRNYLEEAIQKTHRKLRERSIKAMDTLDALMEDPQFQFRYTLQSGESLIVNDREIFHGRTPFRDVQNAISLNEYLRSDRTNMLIKRTFSRFWINE